MALHTAQDLIRELQTIINATGENPWIGLVDMDDMDDDGARYGHSEVASVHVSETEQISGRPVAIITYN